MAKLRKQLSFRQNKNDLMILDFLENEIIPNTGLSYYIKLLISKDPQYLEYIKKNYE